MNRIHVECIPDKRLILKLGYSRKEVFDQGDKSRVYKYLKNTSGQVAMVDEDPNPDPARPKYPYERELELVEEKHGLSRYIDSKRNNTVLVLKGKLEDWIISVCRKSNVDITKPPYSLPDTPNNLHRVLNDRLPAYERLLDDLLANNNEALMTLKKWLQ